ncbi:hypothetical protein ACEQ8H_002666 [Pleosporales sp. CAS-2024a]
MSKLETMAMDAVSEKAEKPGYTGKIKKYTDYDSLSKSLSKPRLLVFSLPHGHVGDSVFQGPIPYLERNDMFLGCGQRTLRIAPQLCGG